MVPSGLKNRYGTSRGTQLHAQGRVCIRGHISVKFIFSVWLLKYMRHDTHVDAYSRDDDTLWKTFSSSTRKRMSVIVRTPSGKLRLYCKGAVSFYLCLLQVWFVVVPNVYVKHSAVEIQHRCLAWRCWHPLLLVFYVIVLGLFRCRVEFLLGQFGALKKYGLGYSYNLIFDT